MTTTSENETLTRVGPGTPMGELMRQYWIPAAMSAELKADGDPTRLMLLGEKLVAFRDSGGKVGIFDHRCPHRRASLFFGRNEEGGIRCVYHGWKFNTDGKCLETLNVPNPEFKERIRARAYRCAERNGIVYAFMGDRAELPPLPEIESTLVPEEDIEIQFVLRECNWYTMVVALVKRGAYPGGRTNLGTEVPGATQNYTMLPNRSAWLGRWRLRANRENDYEIDREVQRTRSYTGIDGVQMQDQAIQESMGKMADRENEHLAPSDVIITRVRRQMLDAVRKYRENGERPPTALRAALYSRIRGGHFLAHRDTDWREAYSATLVATPWENVGKHAGS